LAITSRAAAAAFIKLECSRSAAAAVRAHFRAWRTGADEGIEEVAVIGVGIVVVIGVGIVVVIGVGIEVDGGVADVASIGRGEVDDEGGHGDGDL